MWKRLPRTYEKRFSFHGSDYEYLLVLNLERESVDVQRLDWYNEHAYDMGYQGLLGVTIPAAWGLPSSSVCVLYVEGMNMLGISNVLDYIYNRDYSRRYPDYSYFSRRLAVAGVALTW